MSVLFLHRFYQLCDEFTIRILNIFVMPFILFLRDHYIYILWPYDGSSWQCITECKMKMAQVTRRVIDWSMA